MKQVGVKLSNFQLLLLAAKRGGEESFFYREYKTKDLDAETLKEAVKSLVRRHSVFQMVIKDSFESELSASLETTEIREIDLSMYNDMETELLLSKYKKELCYQFNKLFFLGIYKLPLSQYMVRMYFNQLVFDVESYFFFLNELESFYMHQNNFFSQERVNFITYLQSLEKKKEGEDYIKAQAYWKKRINSLPSGPVFFKNEKENKAEHKKLIQKNFVLNNAQWNELQKICLEIDIVPESLFITIFAKVLSFWSGSTHFTINTIVDDRVSEVENSIGQYNISIPLEINLATAFSSIMKDAQIISKRFQEDSTHKTFDTLDILNLFYENNQEKPQFPVSFRSVLHNIDSDTSFLGELSDSCAYIAGSTLKHSIWMINNELIFTWDFMEHNFEADMITDMFKSYQKVVEGLTLNKSLLFEEKLNLLPESQVKRRIKYNQTSKILDETPLPLKIMQMAFKYPTKEALVSSTKRLSYQQVHNAAVQLAKILSSHKLKKNSYVGIFYEKGWEQIVAVVACGYAGYAYVPMPSDISSQRMKHIISQADISVVLTNQVIEQDNLNIVDIEKVIDVDKDSEEYRICLTPEDIAYTIFTSGSTGTPKGVVITHQSVANTVADINERFQVSEEDVFFNISALSFDLSVYDIYGSLSVGATLIVPDEKDRFEPMKWTEWIKKEKVSVWNSVPAIVDLLMENVSKVELQKLRLVLVSGDFVSPSLVKTMQNKMPRSILVSLGGATEASIWSIYYSLNSFNAPKVPYGFPLSNQNLHIFNEKLEMLPEFTMGEIYISGKGLAKGYLNDESRTKSQFLQKPYPLYKTGDLGYFNSKGYIEILGRKDNQVKLNGYRVELEEIESNIVSIDDIIECCVLVTREENTDLKNLVAFVSAPNENLSDSDIKEKLKQFLSDYMIPNIFIYLDKLPRTENGKIDKKALNEIYRTKAVIKREYKAPVNHLEAQICALFENILNVDRVGLTDDFFALGGHSLLAIKLISKLNAIIDRDLPINILFEAPTVEKLIQKLEENSIRYKTLTPIQPFGSKMPIFAVPGISGISLDFQFLSQSLGAEQPLYAFQETFDKNVPMQTSIEDIVSMYVKEILNISNGPYIIMGYSFGAIIAYEMAKQLENKVFKLILMDMSSPSIPMHFLEMLKMKYNYAKRILYEYRNNKMKEKSIIYSNIMHKQRFHKIGLLYKYHPKAVTSSINCTVFIAEKNSTHQGEYENLMRWQELFPFSKLQYIKIDTDHESLLKKTNARVLATYIQKIISK